MDEGTVLLPSGAAISLRTVGSPLMTKQRKHINSLSKHITMLEQLAISIISQPDLRLFMYEPVYLCVGGGWVLLYHSN